MNWTKKRLKTVALLTLIMLAFTGIFFYLKEASPVKQVAFVTLGLDRDALFEDEGSFETQKALVHFADLSLGWSLDPSFAEAFNDEHPAYEFSVRRQEKQNLIFEVWAPNFVFFVGTDAIYTLLDLYKERLTEYNTQTNESYLIAIEEVSEPIDVPYSYLRTLLLSVLFVWSFSFIYYTSRDYASRN
jgi:hypothetical protein